MGSCTVIKSILRSHNFERTISLIDPDMQGVIIDFEPLNVN